MRDAANEWVGLTLSDCDFVEHAAEPRLRSNPMERFLSAQARTVLETIRDACTLALEPPCPRCGRPHGIDCCPVKNKPTARSQPGDLLDRLVIGGPCHKPDTEAPFAHALCPAGGPHIDCEPPIHEAIAGAVGYRPSTPSILMPILEGDGAAPTRETLREARDLITIRTAERDEARAEAARLKATPAALVDTAREDRIHKLGAEVARLTKLRVGDDHVLDAAEAAQEAMVAQIREPPRCAQRCCS